MRGLDGSAPDGILQVDAATRIVEANRAAERMLGYPAGKLAGIALAALEPRDTEGRPLLESGWAPAARLRSVYAIPEVIVALRRPDGRDFNAAVTGTYLRDEGGHLQGVMLSLRDTARRGRAGVAGGGMEIISTVSHELRSPLTSVKGFTGLMLSRWDRLEDEQKLSMLQQVNHDADRVTRLISELLDITRLESGRLRLRRQMVDLTALSAAVVTKVSLEYPELEATVTFPDGFPPAWADPDKIEQVLTNLLENACKYASPHGLEVAGGVEDGYVSITVTDRGPGISRADLPRVFTKFFRRSEGRPTGSGLGLWISRGLVEAHTGRLVAASEPGSGAVFRFTLPVARPEMLGL